MLREIDRLILLQERLYHAICNTYRLPHEDQCLEWWKTEAAPLVLQQALLDNFYRGQYHYLRGDSAYFQILIHNLASIIQSHSGPLSQGELNRKRESLTRWAMGREILQLPYLVTSLLTDYSNFILNLGSHAISVRMIQEKDLPSKYTHNEAQL